MPIYTDIADELYGPGRGTVPGGVKCYTARSGPITLTRVQISRPGLELSLIHISEPTRRS